MSRQSLAFEVRPSQLVSPYGPGAVVVDRHGITWLVQGLDHWYCSSQSEEHDRKDCENNARPFSFSEPRLAAQLGVSSFRRPPEWREPKDVNKGSVTELTIPSYSFPTIWFCSREDCGKLLRTSIQVSSQRPKCDMHGSKVKFEMKQVSFAIMCEEGHLEDFPVLEWVHRESQSECELKHLRRRRGNKAGWAGIRFYCMNCKKSRGLDRVQVSSGTSSVLQDSTFSSSQTYTCPGKQPWLGKDKPPVPCTKPPVATYLGALNVYFADVQSAIFIPEEITGEELLIALEKLPDHRKDLVDDVLVDYSKEQWVARLREKIGKSRNQDKEDVQFILDANAEQLQRALELKANIGMPVADQGDGESSLKDREFQILLHQPPAMMRPVALPPLTNDLQGSAIGTLTGFGWVQETRALSGFTRKIYPLQSSGPGSESRRHLGLEDNLDWLPAVKTYGDGILVEVDSEKLQHWLKLEGVSEYFRGLKHALAGPPWKGSRFSECVESQGPEIFTAVHSLSHLLIHQIALFAGYNAASLRERVYVGDYGCGFLLHSTDGDADGSLGGLLALATSGSLSALLEAGLRGAQWCANNPICSERAVGHDVSVTLGLAACHSCLYLPETSCEWSNRLLDRHSLIGSMPAGLNSTVSGLFPNF